MGLVSIYRYYSTFVAIAVVAGTLLTSFRASAKPITEEDVLRAKNIIIFVGSFDPTTSGHLGAADAVLRESDTDLIVVLPSPEPIRKKPISIGTRLELLDRAAHSHEKIVYPSSPYRSTSDWISQVRNWNPNARISALIGEDKVEDTLRVIQLTNRIHPEKWFISGRSGEEITSISRFLPKDRTFFLKTAPTGISSSKVRGILSSTPDLYFNPETASALEGREKLKKLLPADETNAILDRGIYLGKDPNTHKSVFDVLARKFLIRFVRQPLREIGVYDFAKSFLVLKNGAKIPESFVVGDKSYPVLKALGSGLHSSAYLVKIEGKLYVLKVPKDEAAGAKILREANQVHLWVQTHTQISVPKLELSDPEGKWSLSEYIEGDPLYKSFGPGKEPSPEVKASLQNLYQSAQELEKNSDIHLDLAVDNIIVRDGKANLVDLGPLPADLAYRKNFNRLYEHWKAQAKGIYWASITVCLKRRFLEHLNGF